MSDLTAVAAAVRDTAHAAQETWQHAMEEPDLSRDPQPDQERPPTTHDYTDSIERLSATHDDDSHSIERRSAVQDYIFPTEESPTTQDYNPSTEESPTTQDYNSSTGHGTHHRRGGYALTQQQQAAADQVALGRSDRLVADNLNLHRVTITKWRLYHPIFRAEVAARREQLWCEHRERHLALYCKAMQVLEKQMNAEDPSVARQAAKAVIAITMKVLPQQQMDSPDPDEVVRQHARHIKRIDASRTPGVGPIEQIELDRAKEDLRMKEQEWDGVQNAITDPNMEHVYASPPGNGRRNPSGA